MVARLHCAEIGHHDTEPGKPGQHAGLKALATDALGSFRKRGIVRPAFIDDLLAIHLPAHPGYYGEMVWILTMMEFWMREHVDGAGID